MSSVLYHLQVDVQPPLGRHNQSTAYVRGSTFQSEEMHNRANGKNLRETAVLYTAVQICTLVLSP